MDYKNEIHSNFKTLLIDSINECKDKQEYPFIKTSLFFCESLKIKIRVSILYDGIKKEMINVIEKQFKSLLNKYYNIVVDYPNYEYSFEIPTYVNVFYFDLTWIKITCNLMTIQK